MFSMVCSIISTFALGVYVYFLIRTHRENMKMFVVTSKRLEHLYKLMDILSDGCFSPPHRAIYRKVRELGPFKQPKNKREEFELMKTMAIENYSRGRKIILEAMNEAQDPDEKKFLDQKLKETDTIFNLMETIDENSSEEYIQDVIANVNMSVKKLYDLERTGE